MDIVMIKGKNYQSFKNMWDFKGLAYCPLNIIFHLEVKRRVLFMDWHYHSADNICLGTNNGSNNYRHRKNYHCKISTQEFNSHSVSFFKGKTERKLFMTNYLRSRRFTVKQSAKLITLFDRNSLSLRRCSLKLKARARTKSNNFPTPTKQKFYPRYT